MTKFNNLKVKRVKSNLKYTESKLVKKKNTVKGRNSKKVTIIWVSHRKRQHAKRNHAKKGVRKEATRKKATRKKESQKRQFAKGHHVISLLRIQAWILNSII